MDKFGCTALLLVVTVATCTALALGLQHSKEEKAGSPIIVHCQSASQVTNMSLLRWEVDGDELVVWTPGDPKGTWFIEDDAKRERFELNSFALHISDSRLNDSGLYACSGFRELALNATEVLDEVLFEEERTLVTVKGVPKAPPEAPIVAALDAYTVSVKWTHSYREPNRPVNQYLVYTKADDQVEARLTHRVPQPENETTISGLQPFTTYVVYVVAQNDVGNSDQSPLSDSVTTHEAAPSKTAKPRITRFENYTTAIYVEFKPPPLHTLNGRLLGYLLKITNQENSNTGSFVRAEYEPNLTNYNFTGLKPYTVYLISIKIFNNEAEGPEVERVVRTEEDVPDMPRIIHIKKHTYCSVYVVWEAPLEKMGILLGYRLFWRKGELEWNVTLGLVTGYNITNLETYMEYQLQVAARTSRGYGENSKPYSAITDVKGPSAPVITNITRPSPTSIQVDWRRPNITFRQIDQYRIVYRPLNVEADQADRVHITTGVTINNQQGIESELIEKLIPNAMYELTIAGETKSLFFARYYTGEFSEPYRIDLTSWRGVTAYTPYASGNSYRYATLVIEPKDPLVYTATTNADLSSSRAPSQGHLVFGVLAGIFVTAIIFGVGIFVCFTLRDIKLGSVDLPLPCTPSCDRKYMKRSYHFIANPDSNNMPDNQIMMPESYAIKRPVIEKHDTEHEAIPVEAWAGHVANLHADTDLRFSQEYEEINRNVRTDLTFEHSADPENKHKNRYTNIIAYDHSRVILKQLPGKPRQCDYINANYVDGYHKPKAYIATQGPLPPTFADFWRMVWEQNTSVICMITNLTERGRRKCDQYWPNDGEQAYGQLSVKLLNTYKMAHYTVRVFTLKNLKVKRLSTIRRTNRASTKTLGKRPNSIIQEHPPPAKRGGRFTKSASERLLGAGPLQKGAAERLVYQCHYTDWPDHGVPDFTLPVLMYVRKSVAAAGEESGPIIIHCSAGVGRTGTYIVLDSMMRQIKDKGTLNTYGFLSHIRNQRNYLVQTEDQYIFIHDALLEFIQSGGDTEVKDTNISKYYEDLLQPCTTNPTETLLERQFELVASFTPCDFHLTSAMLPANLMKNRSKQILPVELSRVRLPAQPGEEGSDYINASYLQGYNRNEEYIVTQHPLKDTVTDFWRMVWDRNSMTVVLLSLTDTEEYIEFWPAKGETMDCGNFKVTFTEEESHPAYHTRDFILQSTQDDYECTTRMISTSYWPDSCTPLSQAFDLVQTVKTWHQEQQQVEGPIIVIDKFGGTEGGTFCALSTIHDQLHNEGSVDIYIVAKLYHLKRPGIFTKQEDFHLLYKVLESVCDSTPAGDRDSGISNCANYPATMPTHFSEHNDVELTKIQRAETTM